MKNMKTIKSIVAMFVMVLALGCVSITAEAATKKKLTLYVGETVNHSYFFMGDIKSVKSNKSKIVKASKYKDGSKMIAKKKGTAKVTVKGTRGTMIITVTVKAKPKFNVTLTPRADGYVTVQVKNNSSAYVNDVDVDITYRNAAGVVIGDSSTNIWYLGKGKTGANDANPYVYPYTDEDIDWSKTTYTVSYNRDIEYKYTDYTKKVKFSVSEGTNSYGSRVVNVKTSVSKYKGSNSIYAAYSVIFYDATGNIVDVRDNYDFLTGSKKKYRSSTTSISFPYEAVSYKVTHKRAFMTKRN